MRNDKYGMPPPTNRQEFEQNIFLSIEAALFRINNQIEDPGFMYSILPKLAELKPLPNGRINFNQVDESLRLDANSRRWMELMPPPELIKKDDKENK
ncbi:hypothetical protein [uncultured Cyclobacterium sp.]|uniref:hypothetical protein n=1 Tax=uncultured Cyclobacterium sp. TaxID=453820 RepID=UPI0030EF4EAC|tara:strand:- start:126771 stop:127061 length:291 start_codon:yes stop_codon:yes gene_type:complete